MKLKDKEPEIRYYSDIVNDDFASNTINTDPVGADFKFIRTSLIWRVSAWYFYYIFAIPIIWMVAKVYLGIKVENRKVIKKVCKKGFFVYCNHTRELDAFICPIVAFPSKVYTIASADAVSIKGIRWLVMMLGCLPIPTKVEAMPKFIKAIEKRASEKNCIAIFPEAHIWPFYNEIRPFKSVSFRYPINFNMPVVTATVTYRKRTGLFRFAKKPGMTVHIGEPLYPDAALPARQRKENLRDRAYAQMCEYAKRNEVEYIKYVRKSEG